MPSEKEADVERALHFKFKPNNRKSGGGEAEDLLPDQFEYELLPSYIVAEWEA